MLNSLKSRIAIPTIAIALFSAGIMGGLTLQTAKNRLTETARDRLLLAATSQKTSIEMIGEQAKADLNSFAENPLVASNLPDLIENLDPEKDDYSKIIEAFTKPASTAERLAMDGASTETMYGRRHVKVQQAAQKLMTHQGYADLLFIDESGRIVYTATKGSDFTKSLSDADIGASGLARLVAKLKSASDGQFLFEDYASYPVDEFPSAFIGRAVARRSNVAMGSSQEVTRIGFVILRVSPLLFDQSLAHRDGLGQTGEVFATGQDGLLRSNPPLLPAGSAGKPVTSIGIDTGALQQGSDFEYTGADGEPRLVATTPLSVLGAPWILVAEQNRSEALAAIASLIKILIAISLVVAAATIGLGLLFARGVAKPISAMTSAMLKLATGDHSVEIPGMTNKDELGAMAQAVQTFKEAGIEKIRLEERASATNREADKERQRNEAQRQEAAREQAAVVGEVAKGLEKLASGDLTHRLSHQFPVNYEKLRLDFNVAMDQLAQMIKIVSMNAKTIHSGTTEITTAALDLSQRTERQAANLGETAAALDGITSTVRKTADGADHAREVVSIAKADADRGGEVVHQAIAAMSGIEKSSQQISQIIAVIDEIAFQTNLLALNAGVEAARAGDAGRGFAVVASEVRSLAQRSAEAAKEIKTLISASTNHVSHGVDLVGETGKALSRIVTRVAEINRVVSEIAASAQEQASELHQVNARVADMDQVTQQNAAMVEQTTAASVSLTQEVEELGGRIGRFKTEADDVYAQSRPLQHNRAA